MKSPAQLLLFIFLSTIYSTGLLAQPTQINGIVTDSRTKEPLIGVHVTIKDNIYGTITGYKGDFTFTTETPPPFVLQFSFVGYSIVEKEITKADEYLEIKMEEQLFLGEEIVVSASRVEESILRSPVSIEKMNLRDIQQIPTPNFYDGLYQLKGVDMNVHGLTFRLPNTRGFNAYTNFRMNQIVDGVENIAPGLSFAAGNIFGLSQIDIESLEMVIGASSALYGPGGMNGTLLMNSKDPYRYQGLTVSAQTGTMHHNASYLNSVHPYYDVNFRYANAFSNRMAFKITGSFLTATDWHASDFRDRTNLNDPSLNRITNPGYDGDNVYGDESLVSVNMEDIGPTVIDGIAENLDIEKGTPEYDALYNKAIPFFPSQLVSRTGWTEKDLVDYGTNNIRLGGALHYAITDNLEGIFQTNFAQGTSIYTAQNRFSARQFNIISGKMEIRNPNFFVRLWGAAEDAGDSYDTGATALQINERWKPSEQWFQDYIAAYSQNALIYGNMEGAHLFARTVADNRDPISGSIYDVTKPAWPQPGSKEFKDFKKEITSKSIKEGGSRVIDHSKMYHVEGMYNFTHLLKLLEMQVGISHRLYSINSDGTIFADQPGEPITINQFGAYVQLRKNLFNDHLRVTGAGRYDKNEYFKSQFTPRISLVYFVDPAKDHNLRATFQTAYRFPAISDQWSDIFVGAFQVVGGLPEVQEKYNFHTDPVYPLSGRDPIKDKPVIENGPFEIPEFGPEKVLSTEIGYKGLFLNKRLFFDCYLFHNKYKGFIATQLLAQYPYTPQEKRYQTYITTDKPVSSFGWALGADYMLPNGLLFRSNVAYNKLIEGIDDPGVESRFNTPDYRANISVGHHAILPRLGFSVNYHWQNEFLWESSFGVAQMSAFSTVDAHVSYKIPKIMTTIKAGGSNILNHYYTTSFGSSQIGALYYISLTYENLLRR
ncbi:TonB-dependent receptor [Marinilabiliaceae bacterium JC017]|nr:TonB-dependent receptor [Marinilabiliaceae bacterium JC017]